MKITRLLILLFFTFLIYQSTPRTVSSQNGGDAALAGFNHDSSRSERHWEEQFRSVPAPASAREHLRRLTAEPHVAGTKEDLASSFEEKPMTEALKDFAQASEHIERERNRAVENNRADRLRTINDALIAAERDFVDQAGLRGRPWYKHQIYAPGFYTGYAAQPSTDFSQALDDRNGSNARESLASIVAAIRRATETLKRAVD